MLHIVPNLTVTDPTDIAPGFWLVDSFLLFVIDTEVKLMPFFHTIELLFVLVPHRLHFRNAVGLDEHRVVGLFKVVGNGQNG